MSPEPMPAESAAQHVANELQHLRAKRGRGAPAYLEPKTEAHEVILRQLAHGLKRAGSTPARRAAGIVAAVNALRVSVGLQAMSSIAERSFISDAAANAFAHIPTLTIKRLIWRHVSGAKPWHRANAEEVGGF